MTMVVIPGLQLLVLKIAEVMYMYYECTCVIIALRIIFPAVGTNVSIHEHGICMPRMTRIWIT